MDTDTDTDSDRAAEFRRALVATANLGPYRRRRAPAKLIVGSLAAFALAGALTGGAVATVTKTNPLVLEAQAAAKESAQSLTRQLDGTLVGRPFVQFGTGTQKIDIGLRPAGATDLVEGFQCIDAGRFVGYMDSKQYETYPDCEPTSGGAGIDHPVGSGKHTLELTASPHTRFLIWLSWVKIPRLVDSPAQKSELDSGPITRADDLAAFERYEGCMGALGHPMDTIATSIVPAYTVDDSAVTDGSDNRCYVTEYRDVDENWQRAVEQTDIATQSIDACLVVHEVTPAASPSARSKQVQDLDLNLDECAWDQ